MKLLSNIHYLPLFCNFKQLQMTHLQERQAMQRAQQMAFLKEKGLLRESNLHGYVQARQAVQRAKQIIFLKERGLLNEGSVPTETLSMASASVGSNVASAQENE